MIPSLFPDQQDTVDRARASLRRHKSILIQGETGSGKSVMAAYMIAQSRQKNLQSAFVVPRRDLLMQMSKTFDDFEISHSFVAAGKPYNPYTKTHICTVGTLAGRKERIKPDIIFYDECHHGAAQLEQLILYYKTMGVWTIGLSATPEKPNGLGLGEYYDDMVCGPTIRDLINLKRLSDYRLFAPSKPDLSKIKTTGGEYVKSELAQFMEQQDVLIGDAVRHYKDRAMGKLNITFCTSIKHSQMMAEAFKAAGVPSVHMDGETPDEDRQRIARAFARRELLNICSVDLMTFGYDLAAASGIKTAVIESISDCRPTKSLPLQRQKNGRVLRYKSEPGLIFDHSGNWMTHGRPCDVIKWSLAGEKKTKKGGERAIAVRQCPYCFFVHPPRLNCPNCGHEYEVDSRMIGQVDGELKEVDPSIEIKKARVEQGMAKSLNDLIELGRKRGMKNPIGWAKRVYESRDRK